MTLSANALLSVYYLLTIAEHGRVSNSMYRKELTGLCMMVNWKAVWPLPLPLEEGRREEGDGRQVPGRLGGPGFFWCGHYTLRHPVAIKGPLGCISVVQKIILSVLEHRSMCPCILEDLEFDVEVRKVG